MTFVVQADPRPGQSAFLAEKLTRYAAIETALSLIEEGMTGVTIKGESGRVYTEREFRALLKGDDH
jgi:hypothetical protein